MSYAKRKRFKKACREKRVQRSLLLKIIAAWIITVPASALFSAAIYFMLSGMLMA